MASRRARDMDQGPEEITDEAINAQIARQARAVQLKSAAVGLAVTAIVTFLL